MPQVSRRYLNQETQNRILTLFLSSFVLCNSSEMAASLVNDLFTPTEKIMLAKRFSIAYMLLEGYSYDSICRILKVSRTTVGLVSLWLKERGAGFRYIINRIKKSEATKKMFGEISDAFVDLIGSAPGQNWRNTKKYLYGRRKDREKAF